MNCKTLKTLILNACLLMCFSCGSKPLKSDAEKHLRDATLPAENCLKRQFNLKKHKMYGQGATTYDKDNRIETIYDTFYHVGVVSLDEARLMLTQSIDQILEAVNQNEKLRPYLTHYPVTSEQISIDINFKTREEITIPDDTRVPVNEIQEIRSRKGELYYLTRLYVTYPVDPDSKLALSETYEEAKVKLR